MMATHRLYLEDETGEAEATVVAVRGARVAVDRSCFYPGGGGQPCDQGTIVVGPETVLVTAVEADAEGVVWHQCSGEASTAWVGMGAWLRVDADRRRVFSRYHTVLHVLNTIAQRNYGAWMTGAQIGVEGSRIDFQWPGFTPGVCDEVAAAVNAVLALDRRITAGSLPEEEFAQRPELLRTLNVRPPVVEGRVRVVEIEGFDAQACGGTHVHTTGELGEFTIVRTDNKGRNNRRFYVRLS
jgi:misacylated tRNA(Ala) deacylase